MDKDKKGKQHTDDLTYCCYRVLNLPKEAKKDLEYVKGVWFRNKRIPGKKDVPKAVQQRLQPYCGSWVNIPVSAGHPASGLLQGYGGRGGTEERGAEKAAAEKAQHQREK